MRHAGPSPRVRDHRGCHRRQSGGGGGARGVHDLADRGSATPQPRIAKTYLAGLLEPVAAFRSLSPVTLFFSADTSFFVMICRYSVRESLPSPSLSAALKFLRRYEFFAASVRESQPSLLRSSLLKPGSSFDFSANAGPVARASADAISSGLTMFMKILQCC